MIYLIKFVYSFILPPGLLLLLLLVVAIRLWKKQPMYASILLGITFLFYILSTGFVSDKLVRSLEQSYEPPSNVQGDVIVVLGGGATKDTPDFGGSGNLSGSAGNRLLAAARLHERTGLPILFSGGQVFSDSGNEADIATRQLLELGIPASDLLTENRSLNTEQNAMYTAAMLKERGYSRPILMTSAFHLPRSVLNFERIGVTVTPYPVDYWTSVNESLYPAKFSPSSSAFSASGTALKEYLGIAALELKKMW
ncbi:YdcF family protein [Paenibacillus beijingensis]|uniref:Membrane protein n=1 Tax=Paenibacillus beijingensis TaxID=1126833 RepID=A0A0D5NMN1_9BACL|nr:YdcF family protein [Paenibacillus beijingensis]AJY76242.1 membrane protein [Paenibacillus beijingensis]